ncbi:hypothetical protein BS47DRAFT_487908 [Hydnum rufescens UP504]|uniref:Brix domain-containing protein n=1 Tax=Hydnum rufescens UP504 TaxID=1448309 RepID=A0A9P6AHJ0_9AGAM|nr:hypothetical protein BS47DRAFT_487908 [Hydnum rufescens UP504]
MAMSGLPWRKLVRDMRKVMEPNTATRLRERSRNKLRDFLVLAPALGVTHLLAFTLTPLAPSLRIIRLSAGPTLSFRIERYSLTKDLLSSSRHAKSIGMEYLSPPLLVLASFPSPGPGTPSHLPLVMKSFQSLFPPLSPSTISLSSARRVVLISYNAERGTVDFRHYLISVRAAGISRRVRKIMDGAVGKPKAKGGKILDLGNEKDVADYLLRTRLQEDDGYETGSTSAASEADPDEASVRLASDYPGRNNRRGEKRAVKLDEIGPRMEFQLVKIVEGVPGKEGAVLFHQFGASSLVCYFRETITQHIGSSQKRGCRYRCVETISRGETASEEGTTRRAGAKCPAKETRSWWYGERR